MVALLRILFGFIAACLVAGVVQTLFVVTPNDLLADSTRVYGAIILALMAGTQIAVFALPFAVLAVAVAEWCAWRGWLTYALAGLAIAVSGYVVEMATEAGPATIYNNYAFYAFLACGLAGGLAYWKVSGKRAGSWHATGAADPDS